MLGKYSACKLYPSPYTKAIQNEKGTFHFETVFHQVGQTDTEFTG